MNYGRHWSPRPASNRVLQIPTVSSRETTSNSLEYIEADFDSQFVMTDIEVSLFGNWTGVAYRPQTGSNDCKWGYKVFSHGGLQDCGLINLHYWDTEGKISPQQQRQVTNNLTDIVQYLRDWGFVSRFYGSSLRNQNPPK